MTANDLALVRQLALSLAQIDEHSISNGVSSQFLELRHNPDGNEYQVLGNAQGLIHLATKLLELAADGEPGAHYHFDDVGIADHCDLPLVVALRAAPWDKEA